MIKLTDDEINFYKEFSKDVHERLDVLISDFMEEVKTNENENYQALRCVAIRNQLQQLIFDFITSFHSKHYIKTACENFMDELTKKIDDYLFTLSLDGSKETNH